MDLLKAEAPPYTFGHHQQAVVVHIFEIGSQCGIIHVLAKGCLQGSNPQFQRAESLHKCSLEGISDGHDLPCCLHLGTQGSSRLYKFIKRPFGNLHHAVVQSGLKACVGLARHSVFDLVKAVSDGNLCGHLGYWIARSLGC